MSQTDPYSPPQASLAGLTPAEQYERDHGILRYAGFWQRVGASLIDILILSPLIPLDYFLGVQSRLYHLYALGPMELLSAFFYVYLVVRYGGTPGKLMLGLRVAQRDGSPVTLKAALLRYAVLWALNLWLSIVTIVAALGMSDAEFKALGYLERSAALDAQAPMILTVTWLIFGWMFACLVAMLCNRKRRALHDFIAGTVVVRK
jgi:uncharacterized RDD family membrane protein YckC